MLINDNTSDNFENDRNTKKGKPKIEKYQEYKKN